MEAPVPFQRPMTRRTMKLVSSILALCPMVGVAGSAPQETRPLSAAADVPAASLVLEIRCGDQPANWGEVRVEGPGGRVVMAPIGKDGRASIPGFPEGDAEGGAEGDAEGWAKEWACVREVRAGTGERVEAEREQATWCLDPPLHLRRAAQPVTLNLSRSFSIWQFGPRLPHTHASGTATLVRQAGAQGAYAVDECEVEELFGQVRFPGLRPGEYRVIVPWRSEPRLSSADVRLDGAPSRATDLDFQTVLLAEKDAGEMPVREGDWLGSSGSTLGGILLDENGEPLPRGILTLVRSDLPGPRVLPCRETAALGDVLEVLCDDAGKYEVHGLLEGTYLVGARAYGQHGAGHRDACPPMVFESVRFGEGPPHDGKEHTLGISPFPSAVARLEGWVSGEIPLGLRLIATPASRLGELETGVRWDGFFSFGEVPLDDYWIDIPGGDKAMGLCLAAPRAAAAGGEPIEVVPRTAPRLELVAPFPTTRRSEGWLRVTEDLAGRAPGAARRLPPPEKVHWDGIGAAVIEGLPPGRYRVTFSETRDSAGGRPPRLALGWVDIPKVTPARAAIQLETLTGRSFRLFNDDRVHAIQVDIVDAEGRLFGVDIPSGSDRSIVLPTATEGADPQLKAVVRKGLGVKPQVFAIPQDKAFLRCQADGK